MKIVFAIPGFSTDPNSAEGKQVRTIVKTYLGRIGNAEFKPGAIVFKIVGAFAPRSTAAQNSIALNALMRCLTELNVYWLRKHPNTPFLYDSGVYYERTIIWETIPALYARGWGDCKSLAAARVAEMLVFGGEKWVQPVFRFNPNRDGIMFHILVMYADGTNEDPSKILGMEAPRELTG